MRQNRTEPALLWYLSLLDALFSVPLSLYLIEKNLASVAKANRRLSLQLLDFIASSIDYHSEVTEFGSIAMPTRPIAWPADLLGKSAETFSIMSMSTLAKRSGSEPEMFPRTSQSEKGV